MRYTEKKMKKTFCFIFSLFAAFVFCSCASFEPTRNLEEALANVEDGIVYYDREYMESKDLTPPNVPDLEKLGVLKFLFAFDQHQSAGNAEVDTNQLTKREFDIFKAEFENAVAGSRRFPAAQIRQSTPELFDAARKTIERRLAHGGGHTGWSRAWIINFFARLGDGNTAYKNVEALLKHSTLPNMFDNHPPFQIDGNFGGTAGIAEMLLQSHDGHIAVLPALPDAWKTGEFKGFMARGGFRVSAQWQDGRVIACRVDGPEGKHFRLRLNGETIEACGSYEYRS